jgi:hypothetical protein
VAGTNYTTNSQTLTWNAGDSAAKTFTVVILDDGVYSSPNKTFSVTLSGPTGSATLGSPTTAVVTIVDTDNPGTVQLGAATYSVGEAAGSVTITATRTGGAYGAAAVNYATSDGTATAGSDYTAANGTLNWASGDSAAKTFTITILDDTTKESSENLGVTLSGATGATLGSPATASVTIIDDDDPGSIQFSAAAYSANENAGSATITVTRTGGARGAVSVTYATADGTATDGADYTGTTSTLSWTDNDSAAKTFTVTIIDDVTKEPNETVNLSLSGVTGGAAPARGKKARARPGFRGRIDPAAFLSYR